MMRIISGKRRGKKLASLVGDNTRPTLERIKQAFFNAIQFEVSGRTVLDLFSGSGQLGLEALSRGAEYCYFNDISEDACRIIEKNIKDCIFTEISELTCKTYIDCVKMLCIKNAKISLVFLDPPYGHGLIGSALNEIKKAGILESNAIVICESGVDESIDCEGYEIGKEYVYSGIKITILRYNKL